MKRSLLLSILGLALLLPSSPLQAAPPWDHEFTGLQMTAGAPWGVSGSYATNPPQTWLQLNGLSGSDGLAITSQAAGAWNPGTNFTVEFSLNLVAAAPVDLWAQGFYIFTGNREWQILINSDRVTIYGAGQYDVALGVNVDHTFRFVATGNTGSLYLDDNPTPIFSNVASVNVFPSYNQLYVGDWGGSLAGDGRWNSVAWNNSQAIPVAVPEPAMAMLWTGAVAFWWVGRRRRK